MYAMLKSSLRKKFPNVFLRPQGEVGVRRAGHRLYVGGAWDEIGQLQFDFLVQQGLRPEHYLLDIACGSFRLGVKAIPYLEPGHFLGIEKEQSLIDAGLTEELGPELAASRQPEIVVSSNFEFERFNHTPDFAIAQSLFTHLTPALINLCLAKLRPCTHAATKVYCTYFLAKPGFKNPGRSHDHGVFAYTREEMETFGQRNGFQVQYIGDWNHPRKQVMVLYTPV